MLNLIKKFLQNEWKGIRQIGDSITEALKNSYPYKARITENFLNEEVSEKNYPYTHKVMKEISEESGVQYEGVYIRRTPLHTNGVAVEKNIGIDRGLLGSQIKFVGVFAHELGHVKHWKLHKHLNLGYLKLPYKLLASATTNLYSFGFTAYAFIGDNKILDAANGLFEHTGKYLIAATVTNALLIRTREHMADLFAYKYTGLLPTEYLPNERKGIVGNVSKLLAVGPNLITSGYPTRFERDAVCKFFGNEPDISFVEKLNKERELRKEMKNQIKKD